MAFLSGLSDSLFKSFQRFSFSLLYMLWSRRRSFSLKFLNKQRKEASLFLSNFEVGFHPKIHREKDGISGLFSKFSATIKTESDPLQRSSDLEKNAYSGRAYDALAGLSHT